MVSEIRIYVEGGGDRSDTKALFREGMSQFLSQLRELARSKHIRWSIIACGSRNSAFENFCNALSSHAAAFNVLLVDSEASVTALTTTAHLENRDGWSMTGIAEEQCHLMVEVMENWFLADVDALEQYYGQRFNRSAIPRNQNVEKIAKATVETSLNNATRSTQKGTYHKIQHGTQLLAKVNSAIVRDRAPYCDRLFTKLAGQIEPSPPPQTSAVPTQTSATTPQQGDTSQ